MDILTILLGLSGFLFLILVVLLVVFVFRPMEKKKYNKLIRHSGNDLKTIKEQISKEND